MADEQTLVAALSDYYSKNPELISNGQTLSEDEIKARSRAFAKSYVSRALAGDKSAYGGTTPFAEYALNKDGSLNGNLIKKLPAHYANYIAENPPTAAPIAAPVAPPATPDAAVEGPVSIGGEDAQPRADFRHADVIDADIPPATTDGAAAPDATAPGGAATGPEAQATAPAGNVIEHPLGETAPDGYKFQKPDWSKIGAVYAPFEDTPAINGSLQKHEIINGLNSRWFELDYSMMRTLAVYYGGYERDRGFREAMEAFAKSHGVQIDDLINPDSKHEFEIADTSKDKEFERDFKKHLEERGLEADKVLTAEGKDLLDKPTPGAVKKAKAQEVVHQLYKEHSLLLGNPLKAYGNDFGMPLVSAGLAKKDFWDKHWIFGVDSDYAYSQNGNAQLSYGSSVGFRDKGGNMYRDDGQKVMTLMMNGQRFGAEHAINVSRIYLSARQKEPSKDAPQHVRFVVDSGLGAIGRSGRFFVGNNSEFARRRDLMILSALHEGQRAGMVPDLYLSTGRLSNKERVGPLKLENMHEGAVMDMRALGIDPAKLIKYNNDHLDPNYREPKAAADTGVSVSGEDITPGEATPVPPPTVLGEDAVAGPGAEAAVAAEAPAAADAPAAETPPAEPQGSKGITELATTDQAVLAEKLFGGQLPPADGDIEGESPEDKAKRFKAVTLVHSSTKEAQLGARMVEAGRGLETLKGVDYMHADDTDSKNVQDSIKALNALKAAQEPDAKLSLSESDRVQLQADLQTKGRSFLENAAARLEKGAPQASEQIRAALKEAEPAKPAATASNGAGASAKVEPVAGTPSVPLKRTASTDLRASRDDRIAPPAL